MKKIKLGSKAWGKEKKIAPVIVEEPKVEKKSKKKKEVKDDDE